MSIQLTWMKEPTGIDAHGFSEFELSLDLAHVESVGFDGPYVLANLVVDDTAHRCAACLRAALRMVQQ